ncbi:hypothetical protein [Microbulbifer taiwanensis]|uniref:DNA-binding protein n=1 Tax=Microbulbifer taiwanensis TaxID=986746 RepID=A0ABW1YLD6_9GAMM|nr:hypothetical protein [Microbulbifer taiwanensis]
MTRERFAEVSGLREGQVRGQIERGHLPVFSIGRLSLVNVALLTWRELELAPCPVMTKDAFAKASGLRERQVKVQIERGNLPGKTIGRLSLVDVSELVQRCISQANNVVVL